MGRWMIRMAALAAAIVICGCGGGDKPAAQKAAAEGTRVR